MISMIAYYILLVISYYQISAKFDYLGFLLRDVFYIEHLFSFLFLPISFLGIYVLFNSIAKALYSLICFMYLIPAIVVYVLNPLLSNAQALSYLIFCATALLIFKIAEFVVSRFKISHSIKLNLVFLFVLFVFIFIFYDKFNFANVFKNVYDVRVSADYSGSRLEAYFFSSVTKFLIPCMAILFFKGKNYFLLLCCIILILYSYTLGNVKSVLFGFIIALIFANCDTYEDMFKRVGIFFTSLVSIGMLEDYILDTYIIHDYFVRRVILFPPVIGSYFFEFFQNRPLELMAIIGDNTLIPEGYSVSQYIGAYHMPYFTNPSSGVLIQGFVNFGLFGVVVWSCIWSLLLSVLIISRVPAYFIGLVVYIIYLSNTAFLTTLLFTHSLLFGVFLIALLRVKRDSTCNIQ